MRTNLFGELDFEGDGECEQDAATVTLTLALHYDAGKSIYVSETGDEKRKVNLPKSQIKYEATGKHTSEPGKPKYAICDITMPEWLAKDRGPGVSKQRARQL